MAAVRDGGDSTRTTASQIALLRKLDVPVLIVHGSKDRVTPIAGSRRLAEALGPNATLVELDGCGHVPHEETPERFLAALLPWLRERAGLQVGA